MLMIYIMSPIGKVCTNKTETFLGEKPDKDPKILANNMEKESLKTLLTVSDLKREKATS
jgi:hypothetical protein